MKEYFIMGYIFFVVILTGRTSYWYDQLLVLPSICGFTQTGLVSIFSVFSSSGDSLGGVT